ncbi:nuclear transport factor 2 family protein [Xanthomonas campestris pv. campestris]|uniref:nuclear transport factor 2 family protein n=1 Tax=Xanthomonas campestris TaxID=339 RepID=UPI0032E3DB4E
MRVLVLLAVLAAIAGIYNYGGNALDEQQVRDLYAAHDKAMLAQDGEALCAMTAPDFEMVVLYRMDSHQQRRTTTREKYCKANGEWAQALRQVHPSVNLEDVMDYKHSITKIEIAPDEASAMVETRATIGLPGMRMTLRSRDKVIRKRWKTLVERSEGTVWVGPAYD